MIDAPQIVGLSLNEAIEEAVRPDHSVRLKFCIWVEWHGREMMLDRRAIFKLSIHPERPSLGPR